MKMKRILATAVAMLVAISMMPNLSIVAHAARSSSGNCPDCGGWGAVNCGECDGTGEKDCDACEGNGNTSCSNRGHGILTGTCETCGRSLDEPKNISCSTCDGKGTVECAKEVTCSTCGGTGSIPEASVDDTPEDTTPAIVYVPSVATKSVVINDAKAANLEKFCIQGAPDSYLAPVVQGLMEKATTVAPASVKCEVTTALPQEITSYLEKNQNVTIYVKYTDGSYIPVKGSVLARLPKVPWYGPELLKSLFGTVNAAQVK